MAVNETIIRECFELHGFLVRQRRKFVAPTAYDEEEIGLPNRRSSSRPPAVWARAGVRWRVGHLT